MSKRAVLEAFEAGDIGEVEFFELALDAGFSLEEISAALKCWRIDLGDDECPIL